MLDENIYEKVKERHDKQHIFQVFLTSKHLLVIAKRELCYQHLLAVIALLYFQNWIILVKGQVAKVKHVKIKDTLFDLSP